MPFMQPPHSSDTHGTQRRPLRAGGWLWNNNKKYSHLGNRTARDLLVVSEPGGLFVRRVAGCHWSSIASTQLIWTEVSWPLGAVRRKGLQSKWGLHM